MSPSLSSYSSARDRYEIPPCTLKGNGSAGRGLFVEGGVVRSSRWVCFWGDKEILGFEDNRGQDLLAEFVGLPIGGGKEHCGLILYRTTCVGYQKHRWNRYTVELRCEGFYILDREEINSVSDTFDYMRLREEGK